MTSINCAYNCLHQKNGKCEYEEIEPTREGMGSSSVLKAQKKCAHFAENMGAPRFLG